VPAAAVIPAPIAYIKVVAVKKLVVVFIILHFARLTFVYNKFYCEKIKVFKAGFCLNITAWNNGIGSQSYFVGLMIEIMVDRE
jgi:hypothetical protein